MNSIGRGSNPHGAAGLLGMLSFVVSGGICLLPVLLAAVILERPVLAPIFLLVWVAVGAGVSRVLFRAAVALFDSRRENLGMMV